jgi:hypothetical protein
VRFLLHATIAVLVFCLGTPPAHPVSDGAPQSRGPLLVSSARACGMGEMAVPLDDDAAGVWSNPAMVAFGSGWRLQGTRSELFQDITLWSGAILADIPGGPGLPAGETPRGPSRLRAGLAYTRLDLGESDVIDVHGNLLGTFHSADHLVNLALAARPWGPVAAGIAAEFTYSDLSPEVPEIGLPRSRATALSLSFGLAIAPELRLPARDRSPERTSPRRGASFFAKPVAAASILHIGTDVRYNDESGPEELPRRFHAGSGLRAGFDPGSSDRFLDPLRLLQWDFFAGYEYERSMVGEEDIIRHYGVEARAFGLLAVRAGKADDSAGGIVGKTRGIGIGIEGVFPVGFRLDWAEIHRRWSPPTERWEISLFLDPRRL